MVKYQAKEISVGKLFRRPDSKSDVLKHKSKKSSKTISIPSDLSQTILLKDSGIGSELLFIKSLETIYKLGDIDDFKYISEEIAKNLFSDRLDNSFFTWLKDNDLEELVNHINRILLTYHLGFIQLNISEEEQGDFEIHLYNSITVVFAKSVGIEEDKICAFYEALFSSIFSNIFGEEVVVRETSCAISGEDRCDFEVKMG
jgi:predicted hydrocarbon binding protein